MQKYTVIAEVSFEVYDEDEFKAQRQGRIALLRFVKDSEAEGYNDEYEDLPTPNIYPLKVRVVDENGKFLAGYNPELPEDDEEPKNEAE